MLLDLTLNYLITSFAFFIHAISKQVRSVKYFSITLIFYSYWCFHLKNREQKKCVYEKNKM